jgi:hypothetical protein
VVPAFLRVAGDLNWWAPPPLRWLHARIGFSEAPSDDTEIPPPTPQLGETTQRLTSIRAPEPDTIRHPAPLQDEETVRLTPTRAPEPDTIRQPTPLQDEETVRLTPTHAPEPDTIRHSKPATIRLHQRRGYVVLDDNSRFDIEQDCLVGCAPHKSDAVQLGLRPVRIEDRTGAVSDAHAEIRWVNSELVIVDRESANGVFMCAPGRRAWNRLTPWQPTPWLPGASVRIGNRILELEASPDKSS